MVEVADFEAEDFEVVDFEAGDLVGVFVVADLVEDIEAVDLGVVHLLGEPGLQEQHQDLQVALIHIDITDHIVDITDLLGGIIVRGIIDGGIHLGGRDIIIVLGIIVPSM